MVDGRKTGKSYIACKIVQNRRVMGCTHMNLHKPKIRKQSQWQSQLQ